MSNKNKGKKSVFRMIADIISWTIFALLMLLAAFLIYYVIATNIYARKGERFRPIVSLYTIISGSMLPTIKVYDVVVNLRIDDPVKLKEGDVITFISQSKINYGETITHRINKITYNNGAYYFTTKGDNNLVPDETPVEFNNIIGKVVLKIPQLGQAQFFLLKQGSKLFLVLIPSFGILIYDLLKMLNLFDTKKKVDKSLETKDNKLSKEEEEKLKEEIKNRLSDKSLINEDIINKENEDKHSEEEKEIKTEESKEIDKIKEENNEAKTDEVNEDVKVAKVKGWNVYTIQVASVEDKDEISKIEEVLSKEKVPFSTINIEGVNKVQTYVSFDKESIRNHLEGIRVLYPDAFLAEVKIPVLSLEYTSKYSYLETISEQLGSLIDNFELESKLWTDNKNNINLEEYNTILTNRKTMVKNIEKEVSKIDYKGAEVFKSNLTTYLNNVDKNIEEASKSANEQNYNISEGIFLNSLQGYLTFINSIQ